VDSKEYTDTKLIKPDCAWACSCYWIEMHVSYVRFCACTNQPQPVFTENNKEFISFQKIYKFKCQLLESTGVIDCWQLVCWVSDRWSNWITWLCFQFAGEQGSATLRLMRAMTSVTDFHGKFIYAQRTTSQLQQVLRPLPRA